MMKAIRSFLISALLALPLAAFGQGGDTLYSNKVITNAQMLGIGAADILDTYLSPETYTGWELRYVSHTIRRREGRRWSRMLVHQGSFAYADNRAGNANEMSGMYTFTYGVHYNWDLLGGRLNIMAGGQADVEVGFLYNTRNGNNPAQARLALNIAPSAAAAYRFRLGRVPLKARYEVSAPVFGVMFSPNLITASHITRFSLAETTTTTSYRQHLSAVRRSARCLLLTSRSAAPRCAWVISATSVRPR